MLAAQMSFESRAQLELYLDALQAVIDRHEFCARRCCGKGFSEPVQVVLATGDAACRMGTV